MPDNPVYDIEEYDESYQSVTLNNQNGWQKVFITAKQSQLQAQQASGTVLWKYDESDPYIQDPDKDFFIPSPNALGEQTQHIARQIYFFRRVTTPRGQYSDYGIGVFELEEWFDSVSIVI